MISIAATSLVQLIKRISEEARKSAKPCDLSFGTIVSVNPLKIKLSQKVILTEDFFYLTETIATKELNENDKVTLIRSDGGQRYLVIDKVV